MASTAYTRNPKEEDLFVAEQTQRHLRQYRENGGKVIRREEARPYDVTHEKGAAGRIARGELPMSDDRKPINVKTFVTAIRTCHATAERICGITYSVVDDKHILRENGEDGFIIPDWPQFMESDTYATMVVRDFLNIRNHARMNEERNHHTRPASKPAELGRVVIEPWRVGPDIEAHALVGYIPIVEGKHMYIKGQRGSVRVVRAREAYDCTYCGRVIHPNELFGPGIHLQTDHWCHRCLLPAYHAQDWPFELDNLYRPDRGDDPVAAYYGRMACLWNEAERRSQAAPVATLVELVKEAPAETADVRPALTLIETTVERVAADLGQAMRPAAEIPDCLKTKWEKDMADHNRPCLEQLTDDPANLTSSHLMHVIEHISQTAAFQDAMRRGDSFDLGFGIYIKPGGYNCDIHCPLPPGRGERWGHMSRGIEVVNVRDGKYQPIGAMQFQGNIQRFVLDVLPRIETPEMEAKRKGAAA